MPSRASVHDSPARSPPGAAARAGRGLPWPGRRAERDRRGARASQLGQGHAALAHILTNTVGIAGLAGLVALEEEELTNTHKNKNSRRQRRRIREFKRDMAF